MRSVLVEKWDQKAVEMLDRMRKPSMQFHFSSEFEINGHVFGRLEIRKDEKIRSFDSIVIEMKCAKTVSVDAFRKGILLFSKRLFDG